MVRFTEFRRQRRLAVLLPLVAIAIACAAGRAFAQADYPDEQTIRKLAYIWYQTTYTSGLREYERLAEFYYFDNPDDRQRFVEGRPSLNPSQIGYIPTGRDTDIVIAPRPEGLSRYAAPKSWVHFPILGGRIHNRNDIMSWIQLIFINVDGEWRIRFDQFKPTPKEAADPASADIETILQLKRLEDELRTWKGADMDELSVLVAQKRDEVLYTLSAFEAAYKRDAAPGEQVIAQYERRAANYAQVIQQHAWEQVRAQAITETENAIKLLTDGLEKRKQNGHTLLMNRWLEENPQVRRDWQSRDNAIEAMRNWLKDHDTLDGFVYHIER